MDCATDDAIAALIGERPPLHATMTEPPAGLRDPPVARSSGRAVYGTPYDDHVETEHFTINWWTDDVTEDMVARAADALETAWSSLVEEQGWAPPVSSDRFYLWVLLDPSLGGTTGFTTEYTTDLYPDGYPIVFLNPAWGDDEAFWAALSAHEFAHTLQYAVRDYQAGGSEETWYWEASATWSSELADPTVDGHQYTAAWYATQPELRYDSTEGSHQYGIFVLNAWLDEALGAGTMSEVWTLGSDHPDQRWDAILAESTGRSAGALWGGFTGAFGNDLLAESDLYFGAWRQGAVSEGAGGTLPYLGTHYWAARAAVQVEAEGDVVLGDADEVGAVVAVGAGELLAVTGLRDDATYTLHVTTTGEDTGGDTGEDTGGDTGGDDADDPRPDRPKASGEEPAGCGCGGGEAPTVVATLLATWLVRRGRGGAAGG